MILCNDSASIVTEEMTSANSVHQSDQVTIADQLNGVAVIELGVKLTLIVPLDDELVANGTIVYLHQH